MREKILQVVVCPGVKCPSTKSSGGLVLAEPDLCEKLITLSVLWDRDTAGVKVLLQTAVAPVLDQSLESIILVCSGSIGCLGGFLPGVRSCRVVGTVCGSGDGIASVVSLVPPRKSQELVATRSLRDLDIVLVEEFLEFAVTPRVENGV